MTTVFRPRFSPEINLGHLVSAAAVVLTMTGSVLTAYVSLRTDLERQRAEFRIAIAGHGFRLDGVERALAQRRSDERQFHAETRAALARIADRLADLRSQLVQKEDRK